MNRVHGKPTMSLHGACAMLWLLSGLLLSSPSLAQPGTTPPQYYPGTIPPPWMQQPAVQQPAIQQPIAQQPAETAAQPTAQPTTPAGTNNPSPAQPQYPVQYPSRYPGQYPPQYPARYPAAPAWNNSRQQPAQQYYPAPYNRNWPTSPAAPAPQQAQRSLPRIRAPYLETRLESNKAYVHQNLVLTVNVISSTSLKTVDTEMTDNGDVILRQIGDITVDTRTNEDREENVNTIYYLLTPLRSGDIELKPLHIIGTMDNGAGHDVDYDAVGSQTMHLSVSPADPGVQPWLPLHKLELSASLSNDEQVGEGEPLTLTVEQHAVGMSGTQLSSLESRLQAPGHRLYLEKTEYEGTITREGKLLGTRIDRFTLVPQKGNEVTIPALNIDWWNIDRHRRETAFLPGRVLNAGEHGPDNGESANSWLAVSISSTLMWLGLLVIAFLLGRYWKRLEPVVQNSGRQLWQWLAFTSKPARQKLAILLIKLSPTRNMHIVRRWIANSLPRSARMWFCVRNADEEQDPDDWSQVLRFLVNRRLKLSANLPMPRLADYIIEIHPWADADRVRALLGELEAAIFSDYEISDFDHWKNEFKQQIRPHLFAGFRRRYRKLRASTLPELNPGIS